MSMTQALKTLPRGRLNYCWLPAALTFIMTALAIPVSFAQTTCPTPVTASGTECTVPPGTTITVAPANSVGENASAGAEITSNGVTVNLGAATTTGALAQAAASIVFNGSTLVTTATTTATSAGQIGLRALGSGSTINASGSSITMGPANGTTTANGMTGAVAEGGAALFLTNTPITMLGGAAGINNHGVVATGTGSTVSFLGGR